jgi:hypothetical protein
MIYVGVTGVFFNITFGNTSYALIVIKIGQAVLRISRAVP